MVLVGEGVVPPLEHADHAQFATDLLLELLENLRLGPGPNLGDVASEDEALPATACDCAATGLVQITKVADRATTSRHQHRACTVWQQDALHFSGPAPTDSEPTRWVRTWSEL